ncbi:20982_t:CDS:2, partial [Racocetra persica]
NNELMSLLSDLNLIEVGEDGIAVNFEDNDELSPLNIADWIEFVTYGLTDDLDEKLKLIESDHFEWVEEFKMLNSDSINIPALLKTDDLVIVSASVNNEACPKEFKSWKQVVVMTTKSLR